MRNNLKTEGWRSEPFLPPGWMISEGAGGSKYLSDQLKYFRDAKAAIYYMGKNGFSSSLVLALETGIPQKNKKQNIDSMEGTVKAALGIKKEGEAKKHLVGKKRGNPEKQFIEGQNDTKFEIVEGKVKTETDWEDSSESLPVGWKRRIVGGSNMEIIMSPAKRGAVKYKSRFVALQDMIKNNYPADEVKTMKQKMKDYEGWGLSEYLPEQWMYKVHWEGFTKDNRYGENIIYLSEEGQSFQSMKSVLEYMESSERYSPEDAARCQQFLDERRKLTMNTRYQWQSSSTVPAGWKIRRSEGKSDMQYVLSPSGNQYKSRFSAIQDMMKNPEIYSTHEVDTMRKKMVEHESWIMHDNLPDQWVYKISWEGHTKDRAAPKSSIIILSREGAFFTSFKAANQHMDLHGYSKREQKNLQILQKSFCNSLNKAREDWTVDTKTLPDGWKIRNSDGKSGMQWIMSPDGNQYRSRFCAIQDMMKKTDVYSSEEVNVMKSKLIAYESWKEDERLPKSWLYKINWEGHYKDSLALQSNIILLSREGYYFTSFKTAVHHMKKTLNYAAVDYDNLQLLQRSISNNLTKSREDWSEDTMTLPNGWKKRTTDKIEFFLRPDGRQFRSRMCALQSMIKDNYSAEDINSMRDKLCHEGWKADDLLPDNWFYKRTPTYYGNKQSVDYEVLTSSGDHLQSLRAAAKFMTKNFYPEEYEKNFEEFERKQMKNNILEMHTWLTDDSVPYGWKYRQGEHSESRKYFLSPGGEQFLTAFTAFQFMISQKYEEPSLEIMRTHLQEEGWDHCSEIPEGWQQKVKSNKSYQYLSKEGDHLMNAKTALEYLERGNSNNVDIALIKARVKAEEVKLEDKYKWTESGTLPDGWKVRRKMSSTRKMIDFFLAPDGKMLRGKSSALEHLKSLKHSPGDVVKMKSFTWFKKSKKIECEEKATLEEQSEVDSSLMDQESFTDEESLVSSTTDDSITSSLNSSDNIGENCTDDKDSLLSQLDSLREEIQRSASDKFSDVQINLQNYLNLLSKNV